jgi:3-hydroxyisobutyrate dehydrogenase
MGGGIARNLAADPSFTVTVFDFNPDRVQACVDAGATGAGSIPEAVAQADLVITSLPTPEIVFTVVRDNLEASSKAAIWMDVSTIDPRTAKSLEELLSAAGRRFVACPLGKGPAQAEAGTLPLFVGCAPELLDELSDVFACIGEEAHYLGRVEAATAFKIVSNMVGMANLAVLAEGYALCRRCGVDDDAFTHALQATGAWSYQADIRLPLMIARDYDTRFAVDLALKDVRLAVDVAARSGLPVSLGAAGLVQLAAAHNRGWGSEDVTAVLKVIEPSAVTP